MADVNSLTNTLLSHIKRLSHNRHPYPINSCPQLKIHFLENLFFSCLVCLEFRYCFTPTRDTNLFTLIEKGAFPLVNFRLKKTIVAYINMLRVITIQWNGYAAVVIEKNCDLQSLLLSKRQNLEYTLSLS